MQTDLGTLLARGNAIFKFDAADLTPMQLHSDIATDGLGATGHALHAVPPAKAAKPRTQPPLSDTFVVMEFYRLQRATQAGTASTACSPAQRRGHIGRR